ncbi:MAG: hypothetical protein EAX96_15900 [Candidatus Lokiarchaeota archaeon]|nr:hypothetical protein [Candidatus Lokiarchaeota archaeon]
MFEHANISYNKGKKEVLGYLFGEFKEKSVLIDDIVIPKQDATRISVKEAENDIEIIKKIRELDSSYIKKVHVGWYHSHPGLDCFLSGVDEETQKYWQLVNKRMVAIVIDNVQGKIGAFRVRIKGNLSSQYSIKINILD